MLVRPRCTICIWDFRWDLENLKSLCIKVYGCFMFSWIDQWIVFCTLCVVAQFEGVLHVLCVLCWLVFVTSLALVSVVTRIFCSLVILFFFTILNCTYEKIHVEVDVLLGKLVLAWCSICSNFHVVLERQYWWFIIMNSKTSSKNVR